MLAHAFLVGVCVQDKARQPLKLPEQTPQQAKPLLALTVPEVRHLLGHVLWPTPRDRQLLLSWSWWRRWHQSLASYYHIQRRLRAG